MQIEIDTKKIKQMVFENDIPINILAKKSKISSGHLYNIINGEQSKVFERTAFHLARALDCKIEVFSLK